MANDLNRVTLLGNVGTQVDRKQLEGDNSITKFSLATNEQVKNRNTGEYEDFTTWHTIVAFGRMSNYLKNLAKGQKLLVEGKIEYNKHQDKIYAQIKATNVIYLK